MMIQNHSDFDFLPVNNQQKVRYSLPCIAEYEAQKKLSIIKNNNEICLSQIKPTDLLVDLYYAESDFSRHINFFAKRIDFILANHSCSIVTPFPGHNVPGPQGEGVRYRGSTAFEQYQIRLQHTHDNYAARSGSINSTYEQNIFWPWQKITKPSIKLIAPEISFLCSSSSTELNKTVSKLLVKPKQNTVQTLRHIHSAWGSTWSNNSSVDYDDLAIFLVQQVLGRASSYLQDKNRLPFIFELEFFASYFTHIRSQTPLAGGIFANTWIDVCHRPLQDCRITELCETKRILDELTNLSTKGFAPIVTNEWGCIADGNHRVIASWIWNILCECSTSNWSIHDEVFIDSVTKFVLDNSDKMGPLAIHESLRHLAIILRSTENNFSVLQTVKNHAKPNNHIEYLPSVLVLEYCSGAVVKEVYDADNNIVFFSPDIYELMSKNAQLVLSERAAYHFTDCALLPWFELISVHPAAIKCS